MAQQNADPAAPAPTVAIVGSGPSGCYIAQFLRKRWRDAEITIFDRLPVPYGLVRYGVAPDHHGTKAVARQFDRLFERENVRFAGGVEVGGRSPLTLEKLRAAFDIVVLATGLHADRPLSVPGAQLPQVYGSGRLTRLINGHPDETPEDVAFGARAAIVGHGNVSIDLVRIFLTQPHELTQLGLDPALVAALGRLEHLDVVGRSLPHSAKFDTAMARELSKIDDVRFRADGIGEDSAAEDPASQSRHDAIVELVDNSPVEARRTVHFHFGWTPAQVIGADRVNGIRFTASDASGAELLLDADAVCTAIGFSEAVDAPVRRTDHESTTSDLETGYLDRGLYCVGWLRRGPRGTIPENRADARMVADVIAATVSEGNVDIGKPGFTAVEHLLDVATADAPAADPSTLHTLVKELS